MWRRRSANSCTFRRMRACSWRTSAKSSRGTSTTPSTITQTSDSTTWRMSCTGGGRTSSTGRDNRAMRTGRDNRAMRTENNRAMRTENASLLIPVTALTAVTVIGTKAMGRLQQRRLWLLSQQPRKYIRHWGFQRSPTRVPHESHTSPTSPIIPFFRPSFSIVSCVGGDIFTYKKSNKSVRSRGRLIIGRLLLVERAWRLLLVEIIPFLRTLTTLVQSYTCNTTL